VLPPDELLPHTYAYAQALANEVSPASLRETKRQIYGEQHDDVGTAVERSVALIDEMMGGPDYAEGVRAWMEKRPPDFPDPG
jgi:enoyl-CoA hydratase/carnithine racemase